MHKKFCIFIFFYLYVSSFAFSQGKKDTTTVISSFLLDKDTKNPVQIPIDTSMSDIYHYNPVFRNSFSNAFLGNTGQAYQNNKFYERDKIYPFLFAYPYQVYLSDPYKIPHFNTRKPYTKFNYLSSGSSQSSEQVLNFLHTQNIGPDANVGLFYDLIASRGQYVDQNIGSNRLNLFGSYKQDNYSLYASAHMNTIKAQENGGLISIDNFFQHESDDVNYSMFLNDANSRLKYYSLFFTQKYVPSKKDSLSASATENFAFQHTIQYNRFIKTYRDNVSGDDSLFYDNYYYYSFESHDSAFYHDLDNRLDISFRFAKGSQELRAYARHQFRKYSSDYPQIAAVAPRLSLDTVLTENQEDNYNDLSIGGQFMGAIGNWAYETEAELYISGYRQADVALNGMFRRYFTDRQRSISLSGKIASAKPDYFLMNYSSSHFRWNNNFKNTDNIRFRFDYEGKDNFSAAVVLNYYTGYVYFDNYALPAQLSDQLVVPSVYLQKEFAWGPVHHLHKILWQKPSHDIIHLPDLAYGNTTWYQNQLFGVLKFQIGFNFYYYTSYFLDAYMPSTGMFHRQSEMKSGDYPFVDAFLNWNLKRTRFTLQFTNALAGLAGYDHFMAYRYPVFGRTLRFGLSWTFYD